MYTPTSPRILDLSVLIPSYILRFLAIMAFNTTPFSKVYPLEITRAACPTTNLGESSGRHNSQPGSTIACSVKKRRKHSFVWAMRLPGSARWFQVGVVDIR